jgi:hypothetical protein
MEPTNNGLVFAMWQTGRRKSAVVRASNERQIDMELASAGLLVLFGWRCRRLSDRLTRAPCACVSIHELAFVSGWLVLKTLSEDPQLANEGGGHQDTIYWQLPLSCPTVFDLHLFIRPVHGRESDENRLRPASFPIAR